MLMADRLNILWAGLIAGAMALCAAQVVAQPGLVQKQALSLEIASLMVAGCEQKAKAEGWAPVSIAVIDDGGNLLMFIRQDGANMGTIEFAQLKGGTAASLGLGSEELGDRFEFSDPDRPIGVAYVEGITVTPGGLPIRSAGGQLLGGIGVSGAAAEQDVACGQAGIDAISDFLK